MNVSPSTHRFQKRQSLPTHSQFRVRFIRGIEGAMAARELRFLAFRAAVSDRAGNTSDRDSFDAACTHVVVDDRHSGETVGYCRVLLLNAGSELEGCYSARFFDLRNLRDYRRPLAEIGRFCTVPSPAAPDVIRLIWGGIARIARRHGAGMLFGCTSFPRATGTDYADAFAYLVNRHRAPSNRRPVAKSGDFINMYQEKEPDISVALASLPTPLRAYLAMGAWVGDHAVVDQDLQTLLVFTALETERLSPRRMKFLKGCL